MIDRKIKEEDSLGGSDIEFWKEYSTNDATPSYNKRDHFSRSLKNQPNHIKVIKKVDLAEEILET